MSDKKTPRSPPTETVRGISAVQINQARQMVSLHTRGRFPPSQSNSTLNTVNVQNSVSSFIKPSSPSRIATTAFSATSQSSHRFVSEDISIPARGHSGKCNNPQCDHCGTVIIPSPEATLPIKDEPSISVKDWSIHTSKRPILNAEELDALSEKIEYPLPEMIFGNNKVTISNDNLGFKIQFNTLDAMKQTDLDSNLKVSYHKEWADSRDSKKLEELEKLKPYDWTYSTSYNGTIISGDLKRDEETKIPIAELLKPDPILFFDDMVLYEDELGDNGISILQIKIRVMPTCLLLLCRFFLRIDNVIFRIRDTRLYIGFNSNLVVREYKEQEDEYENVVNIVKRENLNKVDPNIYLRDSDWISKNLPTLRCTVYSNKESLSNESSQP